MLGKLIKYEFKNKFKLMLSIYGAFILVTIFGCLSATYLQKGMSPNALSILILVFYGLSFFALYLSTIIYLGLDLNKTLFSAQGYLTYTLPAKRSEILNAKLLSSILWLLSTVIILAVSLTILIFCAIGSEFPSFQEFSYQWSKIMEIKMSTFFIFIGVIAVLGMCTIILWISASLFIGQLSNKNKIPCAILTGIGLYVLNQIVGSVSSIGWIANVARTVDTYNTLPSDTFIQMMIFAVTYELIVDAALYCVSFFINKYKLNLQ